MLTNYKKKLKDQTWIVINNIELITEVAYGFSMIGDFDQDKMDFNFETLHLLSYVPKETEFVAFIGKPLRRQELCNFWHLGQKAYDDLPPRTGTIFS